MADWRNSAGQIEGIVYFECYKDFWSGTKLVKRGHLLIAPDTRHPTPEFYERKECKYLHEVDALTRKMNRQDRDEFGAMMEKDRQIMQMRREKTRSTLRQRMLAADCTPYERRFIQGALQYLENKEKENTEFRMESFFTQREFDSPSTDPIDKPKRQVQPAKMSDRLAALLTK